MRGAFAIASWANVIFRNGEQDTWLKSRRCVAMTVYAFDRKFLECGSFMQPIEPGGQSPQRIVPAHGPAWIT